MLVFLVSIVVVVCVLFRFAERKPVSSMDIGKTVDASYVRCGTNNVKTFIKTEKMVVLIDGVTNVEMGVSVTSVSYRDGHRNV